MTFKEQLYNKTTPRYWHGSAYKTWNKDTSRWGYFYISNSFEYALTYAHKSNRDFGYMYLCGLKESLNIFNPRSKKDARQFVEYLTGDPNDKEAYKLVNQMIDTDWLSLFGEVERESLIKSLIGLGYDGFFNYEWDNKLGLKPALGIFDVSNITIFEVIDATEIRDIIDNNHDMKSHRDEQRHAYLRGEVDKQSAWRKISLLEQSDFVKTKSTAELKEELNKILNRRGK